MQYQLYYTDEGVVRALPCQSLIEALSVFITVAKRFSPAWISAPDGRVVHGEEPKGFARSA